MQHDTVIAIWVRYFSLRNGNDLKTVVAERSAELDLDWGRKIRPPVF